MIWIVYTPAGPHEVQADSYEEAMGEWQTRLRERLAYGHITRRQFRDQWPTGAEVAPRERRKAQG